MITEAMDVNHLGSDVTLRLLSQLAPISSTRSFDRYTPSMFWCKGWRLRLQTFPRFLLTWRLSEMLDGFAGGEIGEQQQQGASEISFWVKR